jgi:hypothetical protein
MAVVVVPVVAVATNPGFVNLKNTPNLGVFFILA